MINVNPYCTTCIKASVCEWTEKLYKLEGTKKKMGVLDITITGCLRYLSADGEVELNVSEDEEDNEEEN